MPFDQRLDSSMHDISRIFCGLEVQDFWHGSEGQRESGLFFDGDGVHNCTGY
ncbi:hypothetical protein RMSM_07656 [Rhodopirellula maiorica SM1]|uniref:Uncharacterized protein n=1 Tax=Rhodopirellula maiorica SM1 TaxID=1265738 RepID=M5R7F7_9BACT|nr:hypothetical protein RMSM_07656 [Rhodopirellula maiorica SM1]